MATGDWAYQGLAQRQRERKGEREGGQGGEGTRRRENIFCACSKCKKWAICMMFNAGGSGQGSECVLLFESPHMPPEFTSQVRRGPVHVWNFFFLSQIHE